MYRLDPAVPLGADLQRAAIERLDNAIARLEQFDDPAEVEKTVHEVRKRCKAVRGLARLVRPALGAEFDKLDRVVRRAARELGAIRDAHATLATFDEMRAAGGLERDEDLELIRAHQVRAANVATAAIGTGDERIKQARRLLVKARKRVRSWDLPDDFGPLRKGVRATYRDGRRGLRRARRSPSDANVHEWRKRVKNLWYEMQLVQAAAPSVLVPLVDRLDDLSEALGDDHDLAVLIAKLQSDPDRFGGSDAVESAVGLARAQQDELRHRAFRLGATIYAEPSGAFATRIEAYWSIAVRRGRELATGGIAELADAAREDRAGGGEARVERERKFLVDEVPDLPDNGVELRQAYLAVDGTVAIRVRDSGGSYMLNVKGGRGAKRSEIEWPMTTEQFEAAWAIADDRRIHKTRYRIPLGYDIVELDVFDEELAGLVYAEVEFDSDEALEAFSPPEWFGPEVTEDDRYSNAALAVDGPPGSETPPAP